MSSRGVFRDLFRGSVMLLAFKTSERVIFHCPESVFFEMYDKDKRYYDLYVFEDYVFLILNDEIVNTFLKTYLIHNLKKLIFSRRKKSFIAFVKRRKSNEKIDFFVYYTLEIPQSWISLHKNSEHFYVLASKDIFIAGLEPKKLWDMYHEIVQTKNLKDKKK